MKTPTAYYLVSFLIYGSDNMMELLRPFSILLVTLKSGLFYLTYYLLPFKPSVLVPVKVLRLHRCSRLHVLNLGIVLGRLFTSVAIQAHMFLSSVWHLCGI